jgi:hypothetical protein
VSQTYLFGQSASHVKVTMAKATLSASAVSALRRAVAE